jgi:hypothetical protein
MTVPSVFRVEAGGAALAKFIEVATDDAWIDTAMHGLGNYGVDDG